MTGKFERARLGDLRNQLRDDLELYLMLQQAREDDVADLPELIRIAHASLQESARQYRDVGGSILPPPRAQAAASSLHASRLEARAKAAERSAPQDTSTEELMKLFDDEPK